MFEGFFGAEWKLYICYFYSFEVEEGDLADFTCEVVGTPKPYLNWIYNGRQLVDDGKYVIFEEEGVNHLQIYDITPEDAGEYLVQAENEHGKVSCTADLQVEGEKTKIHIRYSKNLVQFWKKI